MYRLIRALRVDQVGDHLSGAGLWPLSGVLTVLGVPVRFQEACMTDWRQTTSPLERCAAVMTFHYFSGARAQEVQGDLSTDLQ
jgi:hypothetical protein